jgi:hypothetical protein
MTESVFQWFWQPPINGAAGLIMIADEHPGPEAIQIPFVMEDLPNVLLWIEARIDKGLTFHSFRVYMRDPIGVWGEVGFNDPGSRKYRITQPDLKQSQLSELWDQRLAAAENVPRLNS